ncbi:MAG: 16S rRNA (cytosine(1402)-N(4))-methyltransferase RsmH [Pseudomonadota bacterium]
MTWDGAPPAQGHIPVMRDEALAALAPTPGAVIVDGTFGAGGYTAALLAHSTTVIAIDRDPAAAARASGMAADALTFVEGRFSALDAHARAAGHHAVDGVVLDVGVSSFQFDEAERGFSFRADAPLDMRMSGEGPTAADLINAEDGGTIAHILRVYGEERRAGAIARAIVAERPITTTAALAALCERVAGSSRDKIHAATRTFQALRIAVNDELGELARALAAAERILKSGGRLVVVTFHSLEDRIVKRFFTERAREKAGSRHMPVVEGPKPSLRLITKKPQAPGEAEVLQNPRARSAKLRAAARTDAPPKPFDVADFVPPVRLRSFA